MSLAFRLKWNALGEKAGDFDVLIMLFEVSV